MKILIVEDNMIKLQKVEVFLQSHFSSVSIEKSFSYASGLKKLLEASYDLALLDMSLPTFDQKGTDSGGRTRVFGGKEIARQIVRHKLPTRFVIITQFEGFTLGDRFLSISDIDSDLKEEFDNRYLGIIHFKATDTNWKSELIGVIE